MVAAGALHFLDVMLDDPETELRQIDHLSSFHDAGHFLSQIVQKVANT